MTTSKSRRLIDTRRPENREMTEEQKTVKNPIDYKRLLDRPITAGECRKENNRRRKKNDCWDRSNPTGQPKKENNYRRKHYDRPHPAGKWMQGNQLGRERKNCRNYLCFTEKGGREREGTNCRDHLCTTGKKEEGIGRERTAGSAQTGKGSREGREVG